MATSSDIATLALKHLGVIGEDETPSSAQSTSCTDAYDRLYAEMQEEGFNVWASTSIPSYLMEPLMHCIAARVRPTFFTVSVTERATEQNMAEAMLKGSLRRKRTAAPVQIEDF